MHVAKSPVMRSGFRALKKSVGLDIAVIVGYADVCEFTEQKRSPLDRGNTLCPDFDFGHICAMLQHARLNIVHKAAPGFHLVILSDGTLGQHNSS